MDGVDERAGGGALVRVGIVDDAAVREVAARAEEAGAAPDRVGAALALAPSLAATLPLPGAGETARLWSALATLGAADLGVARTLEPHLDALAILAEARDAGVLVAGADGEDSDDAGPRAADRQHADPLDDPADATWGVYAAEGAGHRLDALQDDDGWTLTGSKPWCSLASRLDRALVTARVGEARGLFAIDLHDDGLAVDPVEGWASHGLPDVPSVAIRAEGARATPVGPPDWYLKRPGFAWGGIGVAAIWLGGAIGVARTVRAAASRREPDQIARMHLGALDAAVSPALALLADAAARVDAGDPHPATLALQVRGTVARAVDAVLATADHALGPAPLALDAGHARRVSDLRVYVRQHHAERDDAQLGDAVLRGEVAW